jgi:hypothetical protein
MLWTALYILIILYWFVMSWKRDGTTQAILNLISLVSIYLAFINPFNNTMHYTIFLPALIIGIVAFTISFILWRRTKPRR